MSGKIDCFFDIASFYSYMAVSYLLSNLKTLADYGVEVEYMSPSQVHQRFHPAFAGAVFNNSPPWAVSKPKKEYLHKYDSARARRDFEKNEIVLPDDATDLWDLGLTQKALRALLEIKTRYLPETYHTTILYLFNAFWTTPRRRIRDAPVLATVLSEIPVGFTPNGAFDSSRKLFNKEEVERIMSAQAAPEMRTELKAISNHLKNRGAFGLPWMDVRSVEGSVEPFWGSDRFHHMFQFLGLPIQEFKLLPPDPSSPRQQSTDSKL